MGASACLLLSCLLQQPLPAAASRAAAEQPELVLFAPGTPAGVAAFGLGNGGIDGARTEPLQVAPGECLTPGGVHVRVRDEGVWIGLPNRRELLFTPDGMLHLRQGGAAGPFAGGAALHLGDGAVLRIDRSGSRRRPLQQVVVVADGRCERLWHRQQPVAATVRDSDWHGVELLCAGDGDAVYRGIGLGPLLVLERLAAPPDTGLPPVRLVLCSGPLQQSLRELAKQFERVEPEVQQAAAQLGQLALHGGRLFGGGQPPPRVDARRLRFALASGYDLSIALADAGAVRLALHAGEARDPLVEWTLGYSSEAHLLHPRLHQGGFGRYYRSGVRLQNPLPEFAARAELLELPAARSVLERLQR